EGASWQGLVTDLLHTGTYVCVLQVLLRTPLRPELAAAFATLRRMALPQYLSATLLVLRDVHVLRLPVDRSLPLALPPAGATLAAQWVFSVLWLRRRGQGPVEWLWRWATWGRRPRWRGDAVPVG